MAVAEGGQREKAIRKAGHKEGCAVPYIRFFLKWEYLRGEFSWLGVFWGGCMVRG